MKRSTKKGFTIVELVIVIAVIAILAAVLIPTFSSLIKKANLSSDMQAVRTINLALQTHEAENGKPANVDQAMLIIEEAGYDVATYHPLTKGYEIYWVDTINRVVLYSTTDRECVYPDDYAGAQFDNLGSWHTLNESYKEAIKYDFEADHSAVEVDKTDDKISSITFKAVETDEDAKDAGSALYAIFVQQNEGALPKDVEIKLPEKVDVSNYIWKPVKEFTGDLIGVSAENPTVISGVTLDESVSFTQSAQFEGQSLGKPSGYNVYGFIDKVTGTSVIENLRFENFTLTSPGNDFANVPGISSNANVLAPIGCIIPGENGEAANVTINNVHVKNGTIEGIGRVSGLVGYIGGFAKGDAKNYLAGSVTISNCTVDAVNMTGGLGSVSYGTAGGLVSYLVRTKADENDNPFTLAIENCSVTNCEISGTAFAAGAIGWLNVKSDDTSAEVYIKGLTLKNNQITRVESTESNGGIKASLLVGGAYGKDRAFFDGVKENISDNTVVSPQGTLKDETGETSVTFDKTKVDDFFANKG